MEDSSFNLARSLQKLATVGSVPLSLAKGFVFNRLSTCVTLGPADAEMADQSRPVLELARVEQGLIVAGQLHPVRMFLGRLRLGFLWKCSTPREKLDDDLDVIY